MTQGHAGSKTLLQQNHLLLNWGYSANAGSSGCGGRGRSGSRSSGSGR